MEPFSLRANRLFPHLSTHMGRISYLSRHQSHSNLPDGSSTYNDPRALSWITRTCQNHSFLRRSSFPGINASALEAVKKVLCDLYNLSRLVFDTGYKKMDFAISRCFPSDYVGAKGRSATESSLPWVREFRGTHFVGCYMMLLKSPRILRLCFLVTFSP